MIPQVRFHARRLLPRWLRGNQGEALGYALGVVVDATIEWFTQGILARFPSEAQDDALAVIGRDRGIIRGFDESRDSYRARLRRWYDDWRQCGHAYAVLNQVAGYLSPHLTAVSIVTNTGMWYQRDSAGNLSWSKATPNNWDWDGATSRWYRFWVIISPPSSLWTEGPVWGNAAQWGGTWGQTPTQTWGSTAKLEHVRTIRQIVAQWKPAHATCEWIVLDFGGSFSPSNPPGAPMPDGLWGRDAKGTAPAVQSRNGTARYWKGS